MTAQAAARQHRSLRPTAPVRAPQSGWHWIPLGTALLLVGGLSAVFLDFGPHSPVVRVLPSSSARLHPHDLVGYITAQVLGAITACALLRLAWGHTAQVLHFGATQPGHGFSDVAAAALETAMTASLVLMILLMTSSVRTARWTPLGNWLLVATLVWQGAPYTGTSLNPARSLGPALIAPLLTNLWPYIAGPLAGALVATGIFALFTRLNTLTAKLFHDPRYRSTLGSDLPTATTGHDRRHTPNR